MISTPSNAFFNKLFRLLPGALIFALIASNAFAGVDMTIFGPKRYDRLKGGPASYTDAFERCEPSDRALVRVTNGSGKATSITAGRVSVNGVAIFSESDFKNQLPLLEREITVNRTNQLAVELKSGGPDTPFVIVELIGKGCDSTPPSVFSPAPLDGSLLNTATPPISAAYADDARGSGIDRASVRLAVDGTDRTASAIVGESGISFNPSPLPEGSHSITVSVADRAANASSLTWGFTTDTIAPVVHVTSHADGAFINTPVIVLGGSLDDPTALVSANGVSGEATPDGFRVSGFSLAEGANTIRVTATDPATNSGSNQILLNLDTAAPQLRFDSPAEGAYLANPRLPVRGIVDEPLLRALVNGTAAELSPGAVSVSEIVLAEGVNTLVMEGWDRAGNRGSVTRSVTVDTIPPVIAVFSPAHGVWLNIPDIAIAGKITDTNLSRLSINGVTVPTDGGSFTYPVRLSEGVNTFTLRAEDLAGNVSEQLLTVKLDIVPPVVTIASPADGVFLNTPVITVEGRVNEPVLSVTVNGVTAAVNDDLTFTAVGVQLTEGENRVTATALDRASNSGSAGITVNLDTVLPAVSIGAPAAGFLTNVPSIAVRGTVSEPHVTISVNGVAAVVEGTTFTATVPLIEENNTLTAVASDRAGNSGNSAVSGTLDTIAPTPPVLALQKTPTTVAAIVLSGTAEASASVKLFAGEALIGTVPADGQGSFHLPTTLAEGPNSFTATATDAAGNESLPSAPLSVVLDTKAPVITVTSPSENQFFNAPQVSVKGSIDEPVLSLSINGQPADLGSADFDLPLTLTPGLNSIKLIAVDLAGNSATETILVTLDSTPPVVTITAPISGSITRTAQVTVAGAISKAYTTATINGAAIAVTDKVFSFTYNLNEGDNTLTVEATDRAGNKGSDAVTVALDTQLPVLSLQAPPEAAAGANVAVTVNASDNNRLTLVELKADGVPIWSGESAASVAEAVSYRLSPSLNAGSEVVFQAKGIDAAGNEGTANATIRITQAAMGPGYIQGKVLDDVRGLRMEGATVAITDGKGETHTLTAGSDGGYFLELPAGNALVKISRPGYTEVERVVAVMPEKKATALDARLNKVSDKENIIAVDGGTASVELTSGSPSIPHNSPFIIELTIPAGALPAPADVRLTPVSNQGLAGVLPSGWSPLAAVDLRFQDPAAGTPIEGSLTGAAALKFPIPQTVQLGPDSVVTLAEYDAASRQWKAKGNANPAADGLSVSAEITTAGQYVLVIADPAPNAPPVPAIGEKLTASNLQSSDFSLISAAGKVVPQASPPSTGLKAAGEVVLTAKEGASPAFTSGLVLNGRITETFDMKSGDKTESPAYTQDIILYRYPCVTNIGAGALGGAVSGVELRTTFPVSPSKDYTIVELLMGKVGLEITVPDTTESGVMVGTDGGRLADADGNIVVIPQGALAQTMPVSTGNGAAAPGAVGDDFILIKVVDVNLTRQTLAASATLAIPAPDGFNPSLPVVVARQIDVKGAARLKLVALARQSGSLISSDTSLAGITMPGIRTSGAYYFLQGKGQIGFVGGTVTDAASNAYTGALVKTDKGSLVDLAASTGNYLLALPVVPFTATATDLYKSDEVSGNGVITAANQAVTVDLRIVMIPPTVVSITPNGVNVQPNVPVVVTFSKSIDKNSMNSSTLKLINSDGTVIAGVFTFSVDGKVVTFSPAELLNSEKSYTVTVSGGIKDLQGYPLGNDTVSTFTVRKTTPPPMPPAGAVSATFPDADGFVTVTATQGSAETGNTVLLINDTSGEIISVTPASNGSFTGRVRAQLGDEIKVVLMDHSGNQTLISYITYKSDDGKYLVTAKGGKVEGEGGTLLEIPEGALVGPTILKITPVVETSLPHPVPNGGKFIGAVNVDSGGFNFQKEVHLSIPVPADLPAGAVPFLAQPQELTNPDGTVEKVYVIIDSTKIVNGRITTASPPFDGVMGFGIFTFLYVDGVVGEDVVISGTAYQDMDGLPGYTPGPDPKINDRPIQGAVIRASGAVNFVSFTNSKGHYATYGFTVPGTCRNFPLTAIHPMTMNKVTANVMTCDAPYYVSNFNLRLAERDTVLPDKTPPVIDVNLAIVPNQGPNARIIAGTVLVGTELQLPVLVTDHVMGNATLTLGFTPPGSDKPNLMPAGITVTGQGQVSTQSGVLTRYSYTSEFPFGVRGSQPFHFKPTQEGIYTFTVEAVDANGNKSGRSISVRAVSQGISLGTGKEGAPTIDGIVPANKSTDVMVTAPIIVWFSEPVDNVTDSTFVLIDSTTGQKVPATVQAGLEGGRVQAVLSPQGNLFYNRGYEVRFTNVITDSFPNTDGAKLNLSSFSATFTTKVPKGYDLMDGTFTGRDIGLYTFTDADGDIFTYAYLTAGSQGWRIVDVTDPTVSYTLYPQSGKIFPAGFDYRYLAVNQDKALLGMTENITYADGNQYGYVRFYDLTTDPDDPPIIGQEKLTEAYSGIPGRLALMGDYAYVSTINTGLQVVSIEQAMATRRAGKPSDGSSIVGVFDSVGQGFGQPNDVAAYGANKALLTTNSGNLLTLDVSQPIPQLMAQFQPTGHHILRVAVAPEYVYLDANGAQEVSDFAVVGTREGRVLTVDLADPYSPRIMGVTKDPAKDPTTDPNGGDLITFVGEVSVSKEAGLAFVTTFNSLQVIDIKDPNNPRLLTTITQLPDESGAIAQLGQIPAIMEKDGWVYLASQSKGVKVVDLDPHHLKTNATPITLAASAKGPSLTDVSIDFEVYPDKAIVPKEAYLIVLEDQNEIWETKLPIVEGKGNVTYPAVAEEKEFDVTKKYESAIRLVDTNNVATEGGNKRIPLQWPILSTDYDHNGKIEDSDRQLGDSGEVFRFWVNDDDDSGETGGGDIPNSGSNGTDGKINGVRDLIDFFPVHVDLMELAGKYDPVKYLYQLRCDKSNINIVETDLVADRSGEYLTGDDNSLDPALNLEAAITRNVTSKGIALSPAFVNKAKDTGNQNAGVILVEGRSEGQYKLTLHILDKDQPVYTSQPLTTNLSGVEQMFRHVNLIQSIGNVSAPPIETGRIGEHKAKGGEKSRIGEPTNFPDSGTDQKYFVKLHGFNNDGQVARGWHSEMFKRLYWAGSRARFVGVSWYGFESIPDYQQNAVNAFRTASIFGQRLSAVTGSAPVTIMAHSLGNMVVSSYLNDHHLTIPMNQRSNIVNYFLFNAAVALEAYLGDYQQYAEGKQNEPFGDFDTGNPMVHPDWQGYQKRFAASEWYQLFSSNDPRRMLTWRNRFTDMPAGVNYYSFYSTGEDVLATHIGTPGLFQAISNAIFHNSRYSWAFQEKWKGRAPLDGLGGTTTMGWGFNYEDALYNPTTGDTVDGATMSQVHLDPVTANNTISDTLLKSKPFFRKKVPDNISPTVFDEGVNVNLQLDFGFERLLAKAIPALTLPTGGWRGGDVTTNGFISKNQAIDMNNPLDKNGNWPSNRKNDGDFNWKHSDIKEVAYTFIYNIFYMIKQ